MREPHARFHAWLLAGAEGAPPRDLAVHASVCAACRASIAAFDRLAFVDPGAATIPSPTRPVTRGVLVRAGRAVGAAAGVMIAATVLGVGGWQLIEAARGEPDGIAGASGPPNQAVLAGSGTPAATASLEASPSQVPGSASETPITSRSSGVPAATLRPGATATPRPAVTPQPSIPGPTSTSVPTPALTVPPTPALTPTPTAVPTPAPTVPGDPILSVASGSGGRPDLSWTVPPDGGAPITGYVLYRGTVPGTYLELTQTGGTTFFDEVAETGVEYFYVVKAVNGAGLGPASNEVSFTP